VFLSPIYEPAFIAEPMLDRLLTEVPWWRRAETRSEFFMADEPVSYTYGKGAGIRTYTAEPWCAGVRPVLDAVNVTLADRGWGPLNVCFLNRYDNQREHLGWHSDDHEGTDHTRPIVVVSFGAEREIWCRPVDDIPGFFPTSNRQRLGDGSIFIMPPGFQQFYQHRIPKADRVVGPRVSLTFRAFRQ
jgi:alkylated DNA repair dioxygenase AlkB